MTRLFRAIFWAAAGVALIMALLPQPPQLPGSPSDKVQHVVAFAALAALASVAYRSASPIALLAGLSAFGTIIELLQAIPALNRDSDAADWIADTIAAGLVLLALAWWRRSQETH